METWQKTVKKVDSDMLIEFHQSQPVNTVTLQALYTSISWLLNPTIFQIYLSWPTFNPFNLPSEFKKPH